MKKNPLLINILLGIPAALTLLSGVFKLLNTPQVKEALTKVGMAQYTPLLGLAEIVFALLFLFPKTSRIGFLLLICYFSGALATDLSHGTPINGSLFILVLVYVSGFFKNRNQFITPAQ